MYIDTHSHLYLPEFDNDREEAVIRARQNGVEKILLPNIDSSSIEPMNNMTLVYPDVCYSMAGLHPTSVKDDYNNELETIEDELKTGKYIGVGEIGIDLYWDKSRLKEQSKAFDHQLGLALKYKLPVVVHARESFAEILEILEKYRNSGLKGIFHAFTGTLETAEKVIDLGFKLGIGGILTYKNSPLPSVVQHIAIENIVLETDSPYLTPVPHRGKRNESSYIHYIAETIQKIKNLPLSDVALITTKNSMDLFFTKNG